MIYILLILLVLLSVNYDLTEKFNNLVSKTMNSVNPTNDPVKNRLKNFIDLIDIHVINLKNRTVKREKIQRQLDEHGLKSSFFEAIDGKTLNRNTLNDKNLINDFMTVTGNLRRKLRKGEIGCSLSHLKIWKNFLKNSQKPYLLIFEDDAVLYPFFSSKLNQVLTELQDTNVKWDALYLNENCYQHFGKKCLGNFVSNQVIQPINVGYGCYGYLITRRFIEKCLPHAYPILMPVDNFIIHRSQVDHDLTVLRLYHPIVDVNRNFISDTQGIK